MPRLFHRIISFEIEGEIYDNSSKAEDIIQHYEWKVQHDDTNLVITASTKNKNGRIVNLTRIPKTFKSRKVDTNYYIV
jgi:hypothetical protein